MWTKLWQGLVVLARVVAVVFAAAVPIVISLQQAGHVAFSQAAEKAAWIFGLVVLGVDNLGSLISRSIWKRKRELRDRIDEALMQLLVAISRSKGARLEELGASVWLKKRTTPVRYWGKKETVLWRLRRFRPMNYPHQSHLTWTSRMGLVGACWSAARLRYCNLWALSVNYDEAALAAMTEEQFLKLDSASRAGFTLEEFQATAGKYSEIVATPIFSTDPKPKLLGVLSVDRGMPELGANETFSPALNNGGVNEQVQVIVELIGRLLSKSD